MRENSIFTDLQPRIDDPTLVTREHRATPRRICIRDIKMSVSEPNPTRNVQKFGGRRWEGTHTGNQARMLLDPGDEFFVRLYLWTWIMLSCYRNEERAATRPSATV